MIERVTEVKRMEQEEALKASEAAAKRLIGIRYVEFNSLKKEKRKKSNESFDDLVHNWSLTAR